MTVSERILLIRTLSAEIDRATEKIDELASRMRLLSGCFGELRRDVSAMGEDEPEIPEDSLEELAAIAETTEAA